VNLYAYDDEGNAIIEFYSNEGDQPSIFNCNRLIEDTFEYMDSVGEPGPMYLATSSKFLGVVLWIDGVLTHIPYVQEAMCEARRLSAAN